jgi:predicted AlkP superfamily pyrophosphatase or phosphodiesterase
MTNRLKGTLLSIVLAALVAAPAQSQVPDSSKPKLVLFITVDAMRPDYLSRFEPQLTGGLGSLYRGCAVFTNAFQDHVITETAPGHSATMSGRFPVHTGISVDIAPTLAAIVHAAPQGKLDGHVLQNAIR